MPSTFPDTTPRPGDTKVELLQKILQSLGGTWFSNDLEWDLVAKILRAYGGTPSQGDTLMALWQKIRIALGNTACICGDDEWQAMRRALEAIGGTASPVDSVYNLLFKFAQIAGGTPVPPPSIPAPIIESGDLNTLLLSNLPPSGQLIVEVSSDGINWVVFTQVPITSDPQSVDITGETDGFFRARVEVDGVFSPYSDVLEVYRPPIVFGNIPHDDMDDYSPPEDLAGLNGGENGNNGFTISWASDYVDTTYGDTAAPLDPDDVANLEVWSDASQIVGLNDGDPVGSWLDLSGNGRHFTAAGAQRPTYNTNVQNGLAGVNLTSTSGVGMTGAFTRNAGNTTIMITFRSNTLLNFAGRRVINGSNNWLIGPYAGYCQIFSGAVFVPSYEPTLDTICMICTTDTTPFTRSHINGGVGGYIAAVIGFPGTIHLGASGAFNEPADARLFEVAIWSRTLTVAEIVALSARQMTKWGI